MIVGPIGSNWDAGGKGFRGAGWQNFYSEKPSEGRLDSNQSRFSEGSIGGSEREYGEKKGASTGSSLLADDGQAVTKGRGERERRGREWREKMSGILTRIFR